MELDKAKILEWLNRKYERATAIEKAEAYRDIYLEVESGTFDKVTHEVSG